MYLLLPFSLYLSRVRSYLQSNLDLTNLYITQFSVFPVPVIVNIWEIKFDITKLCYSNYILSDPWPFDSLYQGSTATVFKINSLSNIQYLKMLAFL